MAALSFLLLWLKVTLAQDQWRFVHADGSVEAVWGTPQLSAERKAEVVTAWVWSGSRAPRRVSPERIGRERFSDDAGRLAVHVSRRAGGKPPDDLRLLAAPLEGPNGETLLSFLRRNRRQTFRDISLPVREGAWQTTRRRRSLPTCSSPSR